MTIECKPPAARALGPVAMTGPAAFSLPYMNNKALGLDVQVFFSAGIRRNPAVRPGGPLAGLMSFATFFLGRAALSTRTFGVRENGGIVVRCFDGRTGLIDGFDVSSGHCSLPGALRIACLGDFGLLKPGLGGGCGDVRGRNIGHGSSTWQRGITTHSGRAQGFIGDLGFVSRAD